MHIEKKHKKNQTLNLNLNLSLSKQLPPTRFWFFLLKPPHTSPSFSPDWNSFSLPPHRFPPSSSPSQPKPVPSPWLKPKQPPHPFNRGSISFQPATDLLPFRRNLQPAAQQPHLPSLPKPNSSPLYFHPSSPQWSQPNRQQQDPRTTAAKEDYQRRPPPSHTAAGDLLHCQRASVSRPDQSLQ